MPAEKNLYVIFEWNDKHDFKKRNIGMRQIKLSKKVHKLFDAWSKKYDHPWRTGVRVLLNKVDVVEKGNKTLAEVIQDCGIPESKWSAKDYRLTFRVNFLYKVTFNWPHPDTGETCTQISDEDIMDTLNVIVKKWSNQQKIKFERITNVEINDDIVLPRNALVRSKLTFVQQIKQMLEKEENSDTDLKTVLGELKVKCTIWCPGGGPRRINLSSLGRGVGKQKNIRKRKMIGF